MSEVKRIKENLETLKLTNSMRLIWQGELLKDIELLVNVIEGYEQALKEIESLNEYYSGAIASKALDNE